jgi:multidrug efflux system outer membrane protein
MTLPQVVEYALEHSPDLQSAQVEVRRREALVGTAHSDLMPQVELSADAAHSRFEHGYPAGTPPSLLRFDTTLYTAAADLKFLIWDFHKTELELESARERVSAAKAAVERRCQEIIFETARIFLQSQTYSDLINAAESRHNSLQTLFERTNRLIQGGRAVPVDGLKIRTRLAQLESDLATLRAGRRTSLSNLAAVMGLESGLPDLVYTPASSQPPTVAVPEDDMLRNAVVGRPEIKSQAYTIRASEQAEEAIRKSALPRIDLRASLIQYGSMSPTEFPELIGRLLPAFPASAPTGGSGATDWLIGVHVSFPLFDGGRRKGQIEAAEAQLEQVRLAHRQLELRIAREVRTAMADLESAENRVTALRHTVVESERVLHDERLKFEAGRTVIDFVLDAESALLTNQSLLSQAQRSVTVANLALDLSTGKIYGTRLSDR